LHVLTFIVLLTHTLPLSTIVFNFIAVDSEVITTIVMYPKLWKPALYGEKTIVISIKVFDAVAKFFHQSKMYKISKQ
jgi:hypothetical protein